MRTAIVLRCLDGQTFIVVPVGGGRLDPIQGDVALDPQIPTFGEMSVTAGDIEDEISEIQLALFDLGDAQLH